MTDDTTRLFQSSSRSDTFVRMILLCFVVLATRVDGAEWHLDRKADSDVTFTSEVVSFSFAGSNDKVDGYLYWEGPALFEGKPQLLFQVEVIAFDTGIGKRDSDLRDVLATDKHPLATYKASIIGHEAIRDSSGVETGSHHVRTRGTMNLRGVERTIDVDGVLAFGDSTATITSEFDIRLEQYGIEAPSLAAFVKVSERIDLAVHLSLKRVK